jgi:hypothetical protein
MIGLLLALLYRAKDNVPFGTAYTAAHYRLGTSMSTGALDLPGKPATTTLEVSDAHASGTTVTADGARALCRDGARSLRKFLE